MRERYYLFQELDLRAVLEAQGQKMVNEIDGLEPRRLLDSDLEEFCNYFEHKYKLQAPELKEAEIEVDHEEIQVDVRGDPNRPFIIDRSRP